MVLLKVSHQKNNKQLKKEIKGIKGIKY